MSSKGTLPITLMQRLYRDPDVDLAEADEWSMVAQSLGWHEPVRDAPEGLAERITARIFEQDGASRSALAESRPQHGGGYINVLAIGRGERANPKNEALLLTPYLFEHDGCADLPVPSADQIGNSNGPAARLRSWAQPRWRLALLLVQAAALCALYAAASEAQQPLPLRDGVAGVAAEAEQSVGAHPAFQFMGERCLEAGPQRCAQECDVGYASSCATLGQYHHDRGHSEQALPLLEKACKQHVATACRLLSTMQALDDLPTPEQEPGQPLRQRCAQKDMSACYELSRAYLVQGDNDKAMTLIRFACREGKYRPACEDLMAMRLRWYEHRRKGLTCGCRSNDLMCLMRCRAKR